MRAILALIPLCGCQIIFSATGSEPPSDALDELDGANDIDGPVDAAIGPSIAAGDIDNDGTPNGEDLCPLDNTVSTIGADPDSDGIATSCDPNPNQPDCIVLLDGFQTATAPLAGWTGGWMHRLCDGAQGFCSPEMSGISIVFFEVPYLVTRVDSEIRIDVDHGLGAAIELFADLDPAGGGTGRACAVVRDVATGRGKGAVQDLVSGAASEQASEMTSTPFGSRVYTLRWTPPGDATPKDCIVEPTGDAAATINTTLPQPTGAKRIGLRANNAEVRLHNIIAYAAGQCPN